MICLQVTSTYITGDFRVSVEQICDPNNDAEESETRLSLDDEIIVETAFSPCLLQSPKDCFYLLPGRPLPYVSISLHFPPPNIG